MYTMESSVVEKQLPEKSEKRDEATIESNIILYKRRWLILAIFSLISMSNEIIWISLSSIASIVTGYYQISFHAVHWLALIFPLSNLATMIVAIYVQNRFGLKATVLGGALSNTCAGVFRLIAYERNGFAYACVGNFFGGLGQSFLIFVPPTLAATWFGEKERGKASAIGMFANMLGVAVGYLMGTMFVPQSNDYDGVVKKGMFTTLLCQLIFFTLLLALSIAFIQKAPPTPPSRSQAMNIARREKKQQANSQLDSIPSSTHDLGELISTGLFKNWRSVFTSLSFHLLCQAYGIYFGIFVAFSNMLNEITTQYYPGKEEFIGIMGFSSVLFGIFGILLAGFWIDRTHKYKVLCVAIFIGSVTSMILFTAVMKYSHSFAAVFASYCAYGFFSFPYLSAGLEYIVEVMYPIKESSLSMILMTIGPVYGFISTHSFGAILDKAGPEVAGYVAAGAYLIGLICIIAVKEELKRYNFDIKKPSDLERSVSEITVVPE